MRKHLKKVGDSVKIGDIIGEMGNTGASGEPDNSMAPHLHLELRKGNRAVDPEHALSGQSYNYDKKIKQTEMMHSKTQQKYQGGPQNLDYHSRSRKTTQDMKELLENKNQQKEINEELIKELQELKILAAAQLKVNSAGRQPVVVPLPVNQGTQSSEEGGAKTKYGDDHLDSEMENLFQQVSVAFSGLAASHANLSTVTS